MRSRRRSGGHRGIQAQSSRGARARPAHDALGIRGLIGGQIRDAGAQVGEQSELAKVVAVGRDLLQPRPDAGTAGTRLLPQQPLQTLQHRAGLESRRPGAELICDEALDVDETALLRHPLGELG